MIFVFDFLTLFWTKICSVPVPLNFNPFDNLFIDIYVNWMKLRVGEFLKNNIIPKNNIISNLHLIILYMLNHFFCSSPLVSAYFCFASSSFFFSAYSYSLSSFSLKCLYLSFHHSHHSSFFVSSITFYQSPKYPVCFPNLSFILALKSSSTTL